MHKELENIFASFSQWGLETPAILDWLPQVINILNGNNLTKNTKDFKHWHNIVNAIAAFGTADTCDFSQPKVSLQKSNISENQAEALKKLLLKLTPWRKGPFDFFGIKIDSEWQSNLKWQRLKPHLNLTHKKVLDVGCSNGYYAWRALDLGADLVVGIDPSLLFFMQFLAIKNALPEQNLLDNATNLQQKIFHLPISLEQMPSELPVFDSVFSMGVLYHRQSPMEHLSLLYKKLQTGGELFLETLVIDGDATQVLVPEGTYAGMPNVWFLPSAAALEIWLKKLGFIKIEILDLAFTDTNEQRRTEFMPTQSLQDFLTADKKATKEGLPPPQRLVLRCEKP